MHACRQAAAPPTAIGLLAASLFRQPLHQSFPPPNISCSLLCCTSCQTSNSSLTTFICCSGRTAGPQLVPGIPAPNHSGPHNSRASSVTSSRRSCVVCVRPPDLAHRRLQEEDETAVPLPAPAAVAPPVQAKATRPARQKSIPSCYLQ